MLSLPSAYTSWSSAYAPQYAEASDAPTMRVRIAVSRCSRSCMRSSAGSGSLSASSRSPSSISSRCDARISRASAKLWSARKACRCAEGSLGPMVTGLRAGRAASAAAKRVTATSARCRAIARCMLRSTWRTSPPFPCRCPHRTQKGCTLRIRYGSGAGRRVFGCLGTTDSRQIDARRRMPRRGTWKGRSV